eukprot:Platyproteum_vivax@DN16532_c0_g1_i1.p1
MNSCDSMLFLRQMALFNDDSNNVKIIVGAGSKTKEFHLPVKVLTTSSQLFHRLINGVPVYKDKARVKFDDNVIHLPHDNPQIFEALLEMIPCHPKQGNFRNLFGLDASKVVACYHMAMKYELENVTELIRNLTADAPHDFLTIKNIALINTEIFPKIEWGLHCIPKICQALCEANSAVTFRPGSRKSLPRKLSRQFHHILADFHPTSMEQISRLIADTMYDENLRLMQHHEVDDSKEFIRRRLSGWFA